jgi:hypothetical protein
MPPALRNRSGERVTAKSAAGDARIGARIGEITLTGIARI